MKTEIQEVTPFSSGTEAICWTAKNCDKCVRAFKPKSWENYPISSAKKMVNLGRECKMKYHIDIGFITGTIPLDIAELIGWSDHYGLKRQCKSFSDNETDRWKPAPKKHKNAQDTTLF